MHYLIDGYNFLFRVDGFKGKSLEERRKSFIILLNEKLSSVKGYASIIFDSAEQIREFPQCAKLPHLEVIYAPKGQTADAYILELAEHEKNPKNLMIVTSDQGLAKQCQHIGTKTLSIEDFILFLAKKRKKRELGKPNYSQSKEEIERLRKIFEEML